MIATNIETLKQSVGSFVQANNYPKVNHVGTWEKKLLYNINISIPDWHKY
jgi:hypothetical protein